MRAVLQRVASARVEVCGEVVGSVGPGLVVLLGVAVGDVGTAADWLADRTAGLRIFPDAAYPEAGKPMNRSVTDVGGELLVVSQFTLAADTRSGRRPGFSTAASPELAEPLYDRYVAALRALGLTVATGRFGADMQVHLVNDGPATFVLDRGDSI